MSTKYREKACLEVHSNLLHNLGRNVAVSRKAATLTQQALAERAGISRSSIGKIESFNTEDVSLGTIAAIAVCFDLPPYLLMLGKDDWDKLATVSSLTEMAGEGMARIQRMAKDAGDDSNPVIPDIDRLSQLSESEKHAEKEEAFQEIEAVASRLLGQDTNEQARSVATSVSTALGATWLPGMPILNGMIAGILGRHKKSF